jgi:hypothetical protein
MDFKEWFKQTALQPVLEVLNKLADTFKDDQGKVSWRNALETFTQFCDGTLAAEEKKIVDDIINGLGLTSQYDALKNFWQKIPQELRDTIRALKDIQTPITWNLIAVDGKSIGSGDLAGPLSSVIRFTAGSGADKVDLAFSLQVLDSQSAQDRIQVACSADQRILAMSLAGTLSLSIVGSLTSGFFSVSGSVDTGGTAGSIDYYFLNEGKWLLAEALFHNVPHLVSPFEAKAIAAAKTAGLASVNLNVTGALHTSLQAGVRASYGAELTIPGRKLGIADTQVSAGAEISASFTAGLNLVGAWTLRAKPKDDHILSLAVGKDRSRKTSFGIHVEASAGLSGLDVVGLAIIDKYLPSAQALIDKLEGFEDLGSLLRTEINQQLDRLLKTGSDTTLQDDLSEVLVGKESAATLADHLGRAAEAALNSQLAVLEGDAAAAANKILTDMATKLRLPQNLANSLLSKASSKMAKLLDGLKDKLEGQLNKIIAGNKDKLVEIFQPLEAVGQSVAELCKQADGLAKTLLDPVIDFLSQYQKRRQELRDAVAKSANASISLDFASRRDTTTESNTVLEFDIDTRQGNALDRFKEMLVGNFDGALADARNGSGGIILTGGSFKEVLNKSKTTEVNVKIFGSEISAATILRSDVTIEIDAATGKILVAASKGTLEKNLNAFGEGQSITFVNMMGIPESIAQAGSQPGAVESAGTRLELTYADKSLKPSELAAYMGSLQESNLIDKASLDSILERFAEVAKAAAAEGKKVQAYITLDLPLTSAEIQKMIARDNADIQDVAITNQLAAYFKTPDRYRELNEVLGQWNAPAGTKTVQVKIEEIAAAGKLGDVLSRYGINDIDERRNMNTVPSRERHYLHLAHQIGTNAANLVTMVQYVREAAHMTISEENREELRDKISQFNTETNESLKSWLEIPGLLAAIGIETEAIPAVTRAFIATIGQLCQLGEQGAFFLHPRISWSVDGSSSVETF